jgi:hypothetical protein
MRKRRSASWISELILEAVLVDAARGRKPRLLNGLIRLIGRPRKSSKLTTDARRLIFWFRGRFPDGYRMGQVNRWDIRGEGRVLFSMMAE